MITFKSPYIALMACFMLLCQPLWADESKVPTGSYWQCRAQDAANQEWVSEADYQLMATNQAYAACKKASAYPKTCKTSKNACEAFINGHTTRPMWRCIALDRLSKRWSSNIYSNPDDAALAAKAYCQDKSQVPETCYVHVFTCRNINELAN